MNSKYFRLIFYTGSIFLFTNCKPAELNDPTVYNIAPELKKYVDKFFLEASSRGVNIPQENLIVAINSTAEFSDICGKCTQNSKYPTLQRTVEINTESQPCWKTISENDREALVFHELGHCLLARIAHKNDTFADGSPKSIMIASNTDLYGPCVYPIEDDGTLCNKTNRRKYYIDELFDEKTAMPNWAK